MTEPIQEPNKLITALVIALAGKLAQYEDTETAIVVYKLANSAISKLEEIKKSCLQLAEQDMREAGVAHLNNGIGSAGWTSPKTPKLAVDLWREKCRESPCHADAEVRFREAEKRLKQLQKEFMLLPEPRFYIK